VEPTLEEKEKWEKYLVDTAAKDGSSLGTFWTRSRYFAQRLVEGGITFTESEMARAMLQDYEHVVRITFPLDMAERLLELKFDDTPEGGPIYQANMSWLSGFDCWGKQDRGHLTIGTIKHSILTMMGHDTESNERIPFEAHNAICSLPGYQKEFLDQLPSLRRLKTWESGALPDEVYLFFFNALVARESTVSEDARNILWSGLWDFFCYLRKIYGRYSPWSPSMKALWICVSIISGAMLTPVRMNSRRILNFF